MSTMTGSSRALRIQLLFCMAVLILFGATAQATAQDLSFDNKCENNATSAELDFLEEVYNFVYEHRYVLWDEVESGRATYTNVPDSHQDNWLKEIKKVKIGCRFDQHNLCGNEPCRLGRSGFFASFAPLVPELSNEVRICVDNVNRLASTGNCDGFSSGCAPHSAFALHCGNLAHEVMHQADGLEGHGGQGTTPGSPSTSAGTVGDAMENIAISPDLTPRITDVDMSYTDEAISAYHVVISAKIDNLNEHAGPVGTSTLACVNRNGQSRAALYVDGNHVSTADVTVAAVAGDESSSTVTFETYMLAIVPEHVITVVADSEDDLWELDENNNSVSKTISNAVDLAIANIEIAGPYTEYPASTERGAYRELPFLITIKNQSSSLQSARTEQRTISYWTEDVPSGVPDATVEGTVEVDVHSLEPGETVTLETMVTVRLNSHGSVDGTTRAGFYLDYDGLLSDNQRSNNGVILEITEESFKPDYQVAISTVGGTPESYLKTEATCVVRNLGYEPGESRCRAKFAMDGVITGSDGVPPLEAAQSHELQFPVEYGFVNMTGGWSYTYRIDVDTRSKIEETIEDNNFDEWHLYRMEVSLKPEQLEVLFPGSSVIDDYNRASVRDFVKSAEALLVNPAQWLNELNQWLKDTGSPGPTFPDDPEEWIVDYDQVANTIIVMSLRNLYW